MCLCVCVNSLVYSQCYHHSADVSEEEQRNVNNFCSFIHWAPAIRIQLSYTYTNRQTHTPTHTHTTAIIKLRGRRTRGKKMTDSDREGGRETNREREWSGERGMAKDRESCVLNILCLILLRPRLSSSSWLAIRGAWREQASDKDNKDSLLHTL